MRTLLLAVFTLFGPALCDPALAAPAASLFLNPCGPQVFPPPCAAVQHALGQPVTFWVIAKDAQGNLATNYAGTVAITSSDPGAVLPAPHAYTEGDGSIFAFTITFNTPGAGPASTHTVTATDAAGGLTGSSLSFTIPNATAVPIPALSVPVQALLAVAMVALVFIAR